MYKHQSQLQIERLKLYFSALGKLARLIFIRYMWKPTSAGSTAGSTKLDWIGLISPLNRCRQGSEKRAKDMTNIQHALEPSPSSESWVQPAPYLLTLASSMTAWYWVCAMHTLAKRVSLGKTICEGRYGYQSVEYWVFLFPVSFGVFFQ